MAHDGRHRSGAGRVVCRRRKDSGVKCIKCGVRPRMEPFGNYRNPRICDQCFVRALEQLWMEVDIHDAHHGIEDGHASPVLWKREATDD